VACFGPTRFGSEARFVSCPLAWVRAVYDRCRYRWRLLECISSPRNLEAAGVFGGEFAGGKGLLEFPLTIAPRIQPTGSCPHGHVVDSILCLVFVEEGGISSESRGRVFVLVVLRSCLVTGLYAWSCAKLFQ
jgi:hypothetical protein